MEIEISQARQMALDALIGNEMEDSEANVIVEHLIYAELCNSKAVGLRGLPWIVKAYKDSSPRPMEIAKETSVSVLLDGGGKNGMIVGQRAIDIAIQKSKNIGVGICGGFDCSGIGICGYYARQALPHHLIGLVTANSIAAVAPYGSRVPIFGTNPLCIAIPAQKDEIVSDLSTSKMTYGEILLAQKLGIKISGDVLISEDGYPTTDPNDLSRGAILPIAEHKGSALSLALEILAGPLVSAKAGLKAVGGSWGFLVACINPEIFVPITQFEYQIQCLIEEIKNAPPAPGFSNVLIPGERSAQSREANLRKNTINIPEIVMKDLENMIH